jgi:hypothetical protein
MRHRLGRPVPGAAQPSLAARAGCHLGFGRCDPGSSDRQERRVHRGVARDIQGRKGHHKQDDAQPCLAIGRREQRDDDPDRHAHPAGQRHVRDDQQGPDALAEVDRHQQRDREVGTPTRRGGPPATRDPEERATHDGDAHPDGDGRGGHAGVRERRGDEVAEERGDEREEPADRGRAIRGRPPAHRERDRDPDGARVREPVGLGRQDGLPRQRQGARRQADHQRDHQPPPGGRALQGRRHDALVLVRLRQVTVRHRTILGRRQDPRAGGGVAGLGYAGVT